MKEAFKLGGYAWHAHKRFEQLNKGWSFHKTVEWLKTIGIRFHETSMMRFANVYSTYANNPALNASLTESYRLVNEQAEQLTQMPEGKIEILGNIFKAVPSDDTTNPKELIRELIRAGKNLAKVEHFGNKGVRKTYGYGKRTSKLKLAWIAEKQACENGL